MKLCYFKSGKGNFGDDLNPWLWPKLFGNDIFKIQDSTLFIGIGSVLSNGFRQLMAAELDQSTKKIVFGSGIRDYEEDLGFMKDWDIAFVRGPISSKRIFFDNEHYISDPAYCLRLLEKYQKLNQVKKFKVSIMPYYRTMRIFPMARFCAKYGYNLISPLADESPEEKIDKIIQSELLISEAMHGAIVADAVRVPWVRLKFYSHVFEKGNVSSLKWSDWMLSMDLSRDYMIDVFKTSNFLYKIGKKKLVVTPIVFPLLNKKITSALKDREKFQISSDDLLQRKLSEFQEKIIYVKEKYGRN